jgi:hypothetical protein
MSGQHEYSAGFGDGSEPDEFGARRCVLNTNLTHRHLPGDFIRRDKDGDMILMSREAYLKLLARLDAVESEFAELTSI